jgi:hypothetical protein
MACAIILVASCGLVAKPTSGPSSYGRSVAVVVFVFVLTFSPYAHAAETSASGINDPSGARSSPQSTPLLINSRPPSSHGVPAISAARIVSQVLQKRRMGISSA